MNSNFNNNLKTTRCGFTLVEMLFVVAIIAVLGAMAAGILGKAQNDAKIAATRSRITQIEAIMQTVIEDSEVRRLPFRSRDLDNYVVADNPNDRENSRKQLLQKQNLSRRIRAALMQAEFPGPQLDASGNFIANPDAGVLVPDFFPFNPNIKINFRQWAASQRNGGDLVDFLNGGTVKTAEMSYWQDLAGNPTLNLPGEYLYLILERIDIDGKSALETLGSNVVANTDDDDFPEIVDAFGDSMQLRIVQVAVALPAPINVVGDLPAIDIWTDVPQAEINWERSTAVDFNEDGVISADERTKLPNGYRFLNPVVPRSVNKIRFQVVSPNLEVIE